MSLLPLKDAAKAIGVPYNSVWHHYKLGRIPTQKVGRYRLIDPAVLQTLLLAYGYQQKRMNTQPNH
ncbi:hypothetical protein KDA_18230 [Dictyobacter alpinus]|uniref:Helix-turn-helix domain-containing protein n=1 Tax=Dictyobacter alpinus TaxID=2014873 RepID=A0A402B4Q9_9CHLR|nr:hypothetical protein [Dictyobacter alpinus]GCE26339.1 hypothetical protein KDA_18230 [Dictyobacter alpinus]